MIAIFGGSFNPFHNGHEQMINQALKQLDIEKLVILPCKKPPHKSAADYASDYDRLSMLKLYSQNKPKISIEDYELNQEGFSYTAKTLPVLKEKYNDDLIFIIGGDSLENFINWYEPETIVKYATIAVCIRDDCDIAKANLIIDDLRNKIGGNYILLNFEEIDISSSDLRYKIKNNLDISKLVPSEVNKYIKDNNLYSVEKLYTTDELLAEMKKALKEKRYIHTLGVMETAVKLAEINNVDIEAAKAAAILHDSAKHMSAEELVNLCRQNNVYLEESEIIDEVTTLNLVHSKAGMIIAKNIYNISNQDILNSIYYHTVGRANMSVLEKIIFVSDFIEPNRNHKSTPDLNELRKIAFEDLDKAVYYISKSTYDYLESINRPIDKRTVDSVEFYKSFA